MARPRTIPYPKRMGIFLDYRGAGRKVYPVALQYEVARSTVSLVVKEFSEAGFSDRPRLDLPLNILGEAQNDHQLEVTEELEKRPDISIAEPGGNVRGGLNEPDALGEDASDILRAKQTIGLGTRLLWHLKGTEAEKTLEEVGKAIARYNTQCFGFWQLIREDMETQPGYKVAQTGLQQTTTSQGQIYLSLIDALYRRFCSLPNRNESLEPGWPRLRVRAGSNGELELEGSAVAWVLSGGDKLSDHVFKTVRARSEVYLSRGTRLVAAHGDLRYVLSYARRLLGKVTPEQVRQGICPDCPYPESVERPILDQKR